jgi:predicted TIM-barrel fold metal-dependent hydrolase
VTFAFVPADEVAAIRGRLEHPVVDADGHQVEYLPLVRDFVVEEAGTSAGAEFDRIVDSGQRILTVPPGDARRRLGLSRTGWWAFPTRNALDRATAMVPDLLHRRLDEIGIDVCVLYPTHGLFAWAPGAQELRAVLARAFNRYSAEAFAGLRDRLEPVAVIPTVHPDEAVAELDHAVGELGLKAVVLSNVVQRPFPDADPASPGRWIDTLGHDSIHDYGPVWAKCAELGVSPTFHAAGQGWGSRASTVNYVHNHIGSFAAAGEAGARSLLFDGVPRRYPELRFAFLEGGVAWAAALFADVLGHWHKRNGEAVLDYDPDELDRAELGRLIAEHASGPIAERRDRFEYGLNMLSEPIADRSVVDEFARCGIRGEADVIEVFTEQYFYGCEADDPMNAIAFDTRLHAGGRRLGAMFASDIGHWDVPDVREVLVEAYELVEHGRLTDADFAEFAFTNAVRLWGPRFFEGTVVEAEAAKATEAATATG